MVMCLEQTVGENQQPLMLLRPMVAQFSPSVRRLLARRPTESLAMASAVSQNVVRQRVSGLRDSAASCSDFARNCGDEA